MNSTLLAAAISGQEVEVLEKAERRRFTREYKRQIVREADRCRKPGEIGALLRQEGLYSSHLSACPGGPLRSRRTADRGRPEREGASGALGANPPNTTAASARGVT